MLDSINNNFPFVKIEQISEVELVQKADKKYCKDSIDRFLGCLPTDSLEPKLLLCEMKVRVSSISAQQERERFFQYHNNEKYISTHSNSPSSWKYIAKSSERLQVLHHYYTYDQSNLLHIAGDSQKIFSGVLIDIDTSLLEDYTKLLSRLYTIALLPFYEKSVL